MATRPRIVVVTGPTASGKTAFSVTLAKALGAEVVNADSMLVYRGLDIGTAKPTLTERSGVAHHLIDIVSIGEPYNAGRFRIDAARAIEKVLAAGNPCLVVGGTALYIKVLLEGLAEGPERDEEVRRALEARWEEGDKAGLMDELADADPETAARLHQNDRTRIIRALEIWLTTGRKASASRAAHGFSERPFDSLVLAMDVERGELYRRIDARVDAMIAQGLVEEVRSVLSAGWPPEAQPLKAIGYAQVVDHLLNGTPLDEAVAEIKKATRHFARRQLTWMRKFDAVWLDPGDRARGEALAREFLGR